MTAHFVNELHKLAQKSQLVMTDSQRTLWQLDLQIFLEHWEKQLPHASNISLDPLLSATLKKSCTITTRDSTLEIFNPANTDVLEIN